MQGVLPPLTSGEATQEKAQRRLCHFSRMSHSGRMETQLGPGAVAICSSRSVPACCLAELRFYIEGVLSGLWRCCTVLTSPQLSITVRDPVRGQQRHLESMRTGDVTLPAAFPPLERQATIMRSFGLRDVGLERFCTRSIDCGHMVREGGTPCLCHALA